MTEIFGIPTSTVRAAADRADQRLVYALLSLGLAVIFACSTSSTSPTGPVPDGAFCAYFLLAKLGIGYWWGARDHAAPPVGIIGMVIER